MAPFKPFQAALPQGTVGSDMARRSFAAVILNFRPPIRPWARAAAKPAWVRSAISSRSNSARAAKMPNTSLPDAVVVSMAGYLSFACAKPYTLKPIMYGAA